MREKILFIIFKKEFFPLNVVYLKQRRKIRRNKRRNKRSAIIERESKDINNDLFKTYFNFSAPISLAKKLFETKDKKKNSAFVEEIKNKLKLKKCLKKK